MQLGYLFWLTIQRVNLSEISIIEIPFQYKFTIFELMHNIEVFKILFQTPFTVLLFFSFYFQKTFFIANVKRLKGRICEARQFCKGRC